MNTSFKLSLWRRHHSLNIIFIADDFNLNTFNWSVDPNTQNQGLMVYYIILILIS